ncbi:uncharacterized protein [Lolium perenne]|uniref:uncharacterized protein isoform X2 n=1 Tax=Lolium perenne TaxID=4522 RepID=UPI0021F646F2|nr:uncharacterized protein LOC127304224 isoform X2 [Lolium perenne]
MEMAAAHLHRDFFLSPLPYHLAELRIDPPHSAVAFSAPAAAAGGRKRRCLVPAVSPRKKMLLELHPFDSSPTPTPPPSPRRSPTTAPPLLSRRGSPASDFSFPSARPWIGGGGGGNIFAFFEDTPTTPSPTGSNVSTLSFMASSGQPTTPTTGVVTPVASPKKPTQGAGPTANGGFIFTASPEQPLTPASSTAGGGFASLSSEPSLSPREYQSGRAEASLLSPKHARTGSTDSGGLAFFPSPGPAIGHTGSPAFVFSASQTSAPPVRKSGGGSSKKRPRRQHGIVSAPRRNLLQWDVPQQAIQPTQKVVKTNALVTGEASRSSILSDSSTRPCCKFFTSPAKASKQEARKVSSEESHSTSSCGSLAGSRSAYVPSPAKQPSAEKTSKQDQEVEVSSVARERRTHAEPVACTGAVVMVSVTCTCGVRKEFCFDHCH